MVVKAKVFGKILQIPLDSSMEIKPKITSIFCTEIGKSLFVCLIRARQCLWPVGNLTISIADLVGVSAYDMFNFSHNRCFRICIWSCFSRKSLIRLPGPLCLRAVSGRPRRKSVRLGSIVIAALFYKFFPACEEGPFWGPNVLHGFARGVC